jgi:IS1 family transposase
MLRNEDYKDYVRKMSPNPHYYLAFLGAQAYHVRIMNRLDTDSRAQVIRCLVDGNSIRATERITGVTKKAITRLLCDIGEVCREYQDQHFRNLTCKRLQLDEIWSFCGSKEKNTKAEKKAQGWGDVWTWTAIDADTKLIPSWLIGKRDAGCATEFVQDLAARLKNRVQVTTDGHKSYLIAMESAFGADVDYAVLVKIYGKPLNEDKPETRYSPPQCIGIKIDMVTGDPDPGHISTSYVERSNLSIRMQVRRFTRLTNAFSKKIANHAAAFALYMMFYNFVRVHQTLRITPAMAADVSDHVWEIEEIVGLLEQQEKGQTSKAVAS